MLDQASRKQAAKARQEDEAKSRQAWIMQYMDQTDSSEENSEQVCFDHRIRA
jgi:hypothetical protein